MIIVIQDKNGKYHEVEANSGSSKLVSVSNGISAAIINPSNDLFKNISHGRYSMETK